MADQYPVARNAAITRVDYEIQGLRCPVDRCDGELLFLSFSVCEQPRAMRDVVMRGWSTFRGTEGWVEVEYECQGCGSTGHLKAHMDKMPTVVKTEHGARYEVHLGRPSVGGI